jgi:hypothetical protein
MTLQTQKRGNHIKMGKASYLFITVAAVIAASLFLSPVLSQSTNPCAPCHGTDSYTQSFKILTGNAANIIPSTLDIDQIATLTVALENSANTMIFTTLTDVKLTLNSENNRVSMSSPTVSIGTMQKGTATATWQITGLSAGADTLTIMATAKNQHQSVSFSDNYAPSITVMAPVSTPTPTLTPAATATAPSQTQAPTATNTPPSPKPTIPTPTPETPDPSTQPEPTPAPTQENETTSTPEEQIPRNALKIWFTSPREGETLTTGNKANVEWLTNGGSSKFRVKLELSRTGSSGPWTVLAEKPSNVTRFEWTVPNQDAAEYIIRATVIDSANSSHTASVTVAVKTVPATHLDAALMMSSISVIAPIAIVSAIILKKRLQKY